MSHHSAKASYKQLEERLNRFPQGAPPSETLYKILSLLFSEKEAELVAKLPIKPFSLKDAARIWKKSEIETKYILEGLAARAIILDTEYGGKQKYMLPPPMAGFLEFAFMRTRGDLDQKLLSQLYYQYLNVEEDFIKDLFFGTETKLGRVFIQESILTNENIIHILDYERASYFINNSSHIGVSLCYCRHKMQHLDKNCEAPLEICLTFNGVAASLIKNGFAKKIDAIEGLELLHEAYENNLVQCGENVRNNVSFICNCCGCCCEALLAAKRFGLLQPINTTNFIPIIDHTTCNGCQKCVNVCPINAITLIDIKPSNQSIKKQPTINQEICSVLVQRDRLWTGVQMQGGRRKLSALFCLMQCVLARHFLLQAGRYP